MDRSAAAEELARILFSAGIEEGVGTFFKVLSNPLGRKPQQWSSARLWYDSQPDEIREVIRFMVQQAVITAVVGLAVHLDGAAGYEYVGDRPAELEVSLRVYDNIDDALEGRIAESIQVCPKESGEEIHDILLDIVDRS